MVPLVMGLKSLQNVFNWVISGVPISRKKISVYLQSILGDLTVCCFKMAQHVQWNDIGEPEFNVLQEL